MYRIAKQFGFSASHQLTHLPGDHPCARLHGHNYTVTLILQGEHPDPSSAFVRDFRELDGVKVWIDRTFDHRHLNDVLGSPMLTTSESLAHLIFDQFSGIIPELVAVRVSETDKTYAEYSP